jgi:hypothetical protein
MKAFRGIRKIKNGCVRVRGRDYIPDDPHHPYTGELDGQRYLFLGYEPGDYMLNMWGTMDQASKPDSVVPQPHIMNNGVIRWSFWKPVE